MAKPPRPWTVTPHDPLEQLDENLWGVDGEVPGIPGLRRRMHIVRLSDGKLLFHNAVPLADAELAKVRALGTPSILVVPHHLHAMDAHAFREKLDLRAYTPAVVRGKVQEILPVAGTLDELPRDPAVKIEKLTGFTTGEVALCVRSGKNGERASLIFSDAVTNSPRPPGFGGFLMWMMGFTGGPKLPFPVRVRVVKDRPGLRKDLLRLAETPGLTRLVPSHGEIVKDDAATALRMAASTV